MNKFLKYFYTLLCATLVLSLTACGGDDDEPGVVDSSSPVIGSWKLVTRYGSNEYITDYMQFSNTGKITLVTDDYYYGESDIHVATGKWRISDDIIYFSNWVIDWNHTVCDDPDDIDAAYLPRQFTVLSVSSSSLVLDYDGDVATFSKVSDSEVNKYL